ncbi:hypothetical protein [Desulfosarcina ovata]|uniref:Uncharacterized protein n=1 Tax=Desulfosarcina ovata subsp. ovata TaxID=2752305 RepID=A0A5K8A7S9_9BACT|nr:hypothetical protein [Desulfosarcina ovata]BBO88414.1 hypothetical protein DSCOOX_15940 [Desulfosarcina ovata subsp. ovata]
MNKLQAMAHIMALLAEHTPMKPGDRKYKAARKLVAELIDYLGPKAAVIQVAKEKAYTMERIEQLCVQQRFEEKFPPIIF